MPDAVCVLLMVMILFVHEAITPEGKPVAVLIPVAFAVLCIIFVNGVLIHKLGELDAALAVFVFTVMVPVAFTLPHPPVKGIE